MQERGKGTASERAEEGRCGIDLSTVLVFVHAMYCVSCLYV